MPVILDEDETKKWVNSENDFEKLKDLLIPRKSDEIELYQVRRVVNSPKNDAKNNLIPIKENKLF
jgi:putative SOS response-associated peptidase YedK